MLRWESGHARSRILDGWVTDIGSRACHGFWGVRAVGGALLRGGGGVRCGCGVGRRNDAALLDDDGTGGSGGEAGLVAGHLARVEKDV